STTVDIAADESCGTYERALHIIDRGLVPVAVLKPSRLGGLLPTARLIERATESGVRVVLSSLIESAIGRSAIAQLAAARPDLAGPHGLATGAWLADDLAPTPDRIEGGTLALRGGVGLGFEPTVSFDGGSLR
ncbi:MAG: enolase C-terminal domain-like protein, partial [Persicimonas sp.]